MTLDEARECKARLEEQLRRAVVAFETDTGLRVCGLEVARGAVEHIGDAPGQVRVRAEVRL